MKLTHIDSHGKATMVDVTGKGKTEREAKAQGTVRLSPASYEIVRTGVGPKGDIFTVAKVAGIMAAKRTAEMIPLCHPLPLTFAGVDFAFIDKEHSVVITAVAKTTAQTGVEMEALACAMVAGLTIYDMCKAIDKSIELGPFFLVEKSGGKSGAYRRVRNQRG